MLKKISRLEAQIFSLEQQLPEGAASRSSDEYPSTDSSEVTHMRRKIGIGLVVFLTALISALGVLLEDTPTTGMVVISAAFLLGGFGVGIAWPRRHIIRYALLALLTGSIMWVLFFGLGGLFWGVEVKTKPVMSAGLSVEAGVLSPRESHDGVVTIVAVDASSVGPFCLGNLCVPRPSVLVLSLLIAAYIFGPALLFIAGGMQGQLIRKSRSLGELEASPTEENMPEWLIGSRPARNKTVLLFKKFLREPLPIAIVGAIIGAWLPRYFWG